MSRRLSWPWGGQSLVRGSIASRQADSHKGEFTLETATWPHQDGNDPSTVDKNAMLDTQS